LVGAPITGGGPLRPSRSPWPIVGLLGIAGGAALSLHTKSRRAPINRWK
jgi:hypothetical protein